MKHNPITSAVRILTAIIVAILSLGFPSSVRAESEPNDTMGQAEPISVGYTNARLGAQISPASDLDYYVFTAEAGRTYVIETFNILANTNNLATGLWLYSSTGTLLASDPYGDKGTFDADARIVYTFISAGAYYVLAKDRTYATWTGEYALRLLPKYDEPGAAWDSSNDYEPNDELVLANALEVGLSQAQTHQLAPHSAYATNNSDQDYYRFEAVAGRTYVIETYNIQANTNNLATGLWLYSSTDTLLASDPYGDKGTYDADARITYTFVASGTYYILARARTYIAWTGTYSLRILPKFDEPGAAWDSSNDYEPNDSNALAYEIGIGAGQAQTHQLAPNTAFATNALDQDYYHFQAQAGQQYVIETFGVPNNSTGLYLYDVDGTALDSDPYGNYGSGGVDARITSTLLSAGTYIIQVRARAYGSYTGPYSVRVCVDTCSAKPIYLPFIRR